MSEAAVLDGPDLQSDLSTATAKLRREHTLRCVTASFVRAGLLVLGVLTVLMLLAFGLGLLGPTARADDGALIVLTPPAEAVNTAAAAWWQLLIAVPGIALGGAAAWWARGVYALKDDASAAIVAAKKHAAVQTDEFKHVSTIEATVATVVRDVERVKRQVGRVEGMVEVVLLNLGAPIPPRTPHTDDDTDES